jgi:hypothetical protein
MTADEFIKAVAHELKDRVPEDTVRIVIEATDKVAIDTFSAGEKVPLPWLGLDATGWAMSQVKAELKKAQEKFPQLNSPHEGFAVIREKLDELWDAVKSDNAEDAVNDAIQVAAMGARFVVDLGLEA